MEKEKNIEESEKVEKIDKEKIIMKDEEED